MLFDNGQSHYIYYMHSESISTTFCTLETWFVSGMILETLRKVD